VLATLQGFLSDVASGVLSFPHLGVRNWLGRYMLPAVEICVPALVLLADRHLLVLRVHSLSAATFTIVDRASHDTPMIGAVGYEF
jgi:hypothetical protein